MYEVARAKFSVEVGENVFEDLARFGLFKCEMCDEWLSKSNESSTPDVCASCADENGESELDDDDDLFADDGDDCDEDDDEEDVY